MSIQLGRWPLILAAAILGLGLLVGCGDSEAPEEPSGASPEETSEALVPEEVEPEPEPEPAAEPEVEEKAETEPMPEPEPTGPPRVRLETNMGAIVLELYPDKAPETVRNFLAYVDDGFYDGTIFHRVIKGFVIQGGGFTPNMREKQTRAPIQNESGELANLRYTIAMARTANPHSASAQFYINCKTNQSLDKANAPDGWGYCVFGKVVEGGDVVSSIEQVSTGNKAGHAGVPVSAVEIQSAERVG